MICETLYKVAKGMNTNLEKSAVNWSNLRLFYRSNSRNLGSKANESGSVVTRITFRLAFRLLSFVRAIGPTAEWGPQGHTTPQGKYF